ncbi:hypothetical protein [Reticulibacter mediterranei]|nr:hypothetical protein [Reticulibacter mediterranei]
MEKQARDTNTRNPSGYDAGSETSSIYSSARSDIRSLTGDDDVPDNSSIHSHRSEASEEQAGATSHELVRLRRPGETDDDASETSSVSEISITFDREGIVSETSSISEISIDFEREGRREFRGRTGNGSEESTEDERPSASDYSEHLKKKKEPNKLRKNQEDAEENERKLKEFLKKSLELFRGDPSSQQMNNLIIPMAAGSLEQVESKMAPNPRL